MLGERLRLLMGLEQPGYLLIAVCGCFLPWKLAEQLGQLACYLFTCIPGRSALAHPTSETTFVKIDPWLVSSEDIWAKRIT